MTWQGWLTLFVVSLTLVTLARNMLAPSVTFFGALTVLLIAGVITPAQALSGFSNPAPFTVAALYVIARAVEKSGLLQGMVEKTLGRGNGKRASLARLAIPVAGTSAFLNNTPIVAMLSPQVAEWADRRGLPRSRYLMPLSYAAVLGGVMTLIGTSTNVVVSGLLEASNQRPIGMFEITMVGLPVAVVGVLVLVLLTPVLLPDRRATRQQLEEDVREYVVNMEVIPNGPLDGQTVELGGLRHLKGVFLVEIERNGELIAPVEPGTALRGGDRLCFVGRADLVVDLQAMRGLRSSEQHHLASFTNDRHTFFEVVIGPASPLVGRNLREIDFRRRYQAAVVAIHRAGHRVRAKLGDVELKVGDTLVLLSYEGFRHRWYYRNDFLLVSRLGGNLPMKKDKAVFVVICLAAVVLLSSMGILPTLQASFLACMSLVAMKVLTPAEARSAVDIDVVIAVASSFALATALEITGLAERLASLIIVILGHYGPQGALAGIVGGTLVITEILTNNAAAVLMFPIAVAAAAQANADPRPFIIAMTVMASTSFLTPIGYQTNLMVYGPGGYRFGDYFRLGAPLTLTCVVIILLLVPIFWPF